MGRADGRCEGMLDELGAVHADQADGRERCRAVHGAWALRSDEQPWNVAVLFTAPHGNEAAAEYRDRTDLRPPVRVVLTIAHLDHQPENNDPANLRALCQRCHNVYDRAHRAQTRAETRRREQAGAGQGALFDP